jgi:TatD DNase family protein
MKRYIDIHSHDENSSALTIINCFPSEIEESIQNQPHLYFSVGLHPWYIKADYQNQLDIVSTFANNPQVLAIGETGLDKLCKTPFELQIEVFKQHVKLAESIQKPLIIHCVKAYSEIIQLKKELRPTVPWVLHGYRGNKEITQQLLVHDFYLSLGKGIFLLQESLVLIPLDKLFFETDNGEIAIEEVYSLAAKILQLEQESIQKKMESNFKQVFLKSSQA